VKLSSYYIGNCWIQASAAVWSVAASWRMFWGREKLQCLLHVNTNNSVEVTFYTRETFCWSILYQS